VEEPAPTTVTPVTPATPTAPKATEGTFSAVRSCCLPACLPACPPAWPCLSFPDLPLDSPFPRSPIAAPRHTHTHTTERQDHLRRGAQGQDDGLRRPAPGRRAP
jgi:hypothetical protein